MKRWAQAEEPDPYNEPDADPEADPDAEEQTGGAAEPEEPKKKLGAAPRSELCWMCGQDVLVHGLRNHLNVLVGMYIDRQLDR